MAAHHLHQYHTINEERRSRRNYLNPNAQEFHPFFHSSPSSTTSITTTTTSNNNYCYYYNYNYNFPYFYFYNPLHYLPTTNNNYPNYPFNHHHHHHLSLMQPTQPHQLGMGLGQSGAAHHQTAHLRSQGPTSRRYGDSSDISSGGGGGGGRRWDISGSSSNSERKQGHKCNNNDIEWSNKASTSFSSCRQMIIQVKADGRETTAMIRNIPNQYTREMLINFLDKFCRLQNQKLDSNHHHQPIGFDFLYLPMDFKKDANKGYAFVNFTNSIALWKLYLAYSDRRWEHCRSIKICKISCAAIQGKERLVEHFGRSKFRCNHEDYLPVCFKPPRDGSGASVTETAIGQHFPMSSP